MKLTPAVSVAGILHERATGFIVPYRLYIAGEEIVFEC